MAKNIRITKANQIAVNLIEAAWNDLQLYKRLAHEDPHTKIYDEMRQAKGRQWNHMTDLLAAMNGMSFYEMNQSDNYKKMAAIYNES
jgi:hypothetical protein